LLICTVALSPTAFRILLARDLNAPHCLHASIITILFPLLLVPTTAAAVFLTAVGATTFLATTAFLALATPATVSFFFLDFIAVLAALVTDSFPFFFFFVVVVSFFAGAGEGADSGSTATALLDNRVDFLVEDTMIFFLLFLLLTNDNAHTAQGKAKVQPISTTTKRYARL
jgi:hypothetical protein